MHRSRMTTDGPSIYNVETYDEESADWETSGTTDIELDVFRELGYPEINTIYDSEDALAEYIEKYPELDGQKTIGLSLLGSDWRWLITVGNPAGFSLDRKSVV